MAKEKISFIGLGAMGQPMASNIVRKGTALTVYDIVEARMEPVVATGATAAGSVAEAVTGDDAVVAADVHAFAGVVRVVDLVPAGGDVMPEARNPPLASGYLAEPGQRFLGGTP